MKKIALLLVFFGIIALVTVFAVKKDPQSTGQISPSVAQNPACKADQLKATMTLEGAAGNIYGKLEMTNTDTSSCSVTLGDTITAKFDATNVAIHYAEEPALEEFILAPKTTVYSQIHYPNGPQCSGKPIEKEVTFLYQTAIAFDKPAFLQTCPSDKEQTVIDIWPLSKAPITP